MRYVLRAQNCMCMTINILVMDFFFSFSPLFANGMIIVIGVYDSKIDRVTDGPIEQSSLIYNMDYFYIIIIVEDLILIYTFQYIFNFLL